MSVQKIVKVKQILRDEKRILLLLRKKNVVSVEAGTKVSHGKDTGEPCIKVKVKKKQKITSLDSKDIIPKTMSTVDSKKKRVRVVTDVESGAEMPEAYADRKLYKTLKGGVEIGPKGTKFVGTLGVTLTKREYLTKTGKLLSLHGRWLGIINLLDRWGIKLTTKVNVSITNKHVTTTGPSDETSKGTVIVQPGVNGRNIGVVTYDYPLFEDELNEFDWSEINVNDNIKQITEIVQIGSVTGAIKPKIKLQLQKYGRTTLYTVGEITSGPKYINVNYSDMILSFKDVWEVQAIPELNNGKKSFSLGGDSGSQLLTMNNELVLTLFAGDGKNTYGFSTKKIMDKRKLTIPTLSWTNQKTRLQSLGDSVVRRVAV